MEPIDLMVTLWPSFPHFERFSQDGRLSGIRLNSAMITNPELEEELKLIKKLNVNVPLFFDVKGRQLRVADVHLNPAHLDLTLNHPISVQTPTPVLFKAGADNALLDHVEEGGRRLLFRNFPEYMINPGESLHIRHPSLTMEGPIFIDEELRKIEKVRKAGFTKYFLSYVETQREVDQFLELVGKDSEVWLKIETKKGLEYVAREFKKRPNLILVAARGDLYVEIDWPHQIMDALRLIIDKDPQACVGSRILLSVVHEPVPSCADFLELAWLRDIGYTRMMLCDELCLKEDLLATAVNAFEGFRKTYTSPHQQKRITLKEQFTNLFRGGKR
ncbi:MAG: hypothetical protein Q7R79_04760 [bacterium]|nr:hypothetical protein [bacterium]